MSYQKDLLLIWGNDSEGQLGIPESAETQCVDPTLTELQLSDSIVCIACGERHTVIVTADGLTYSTGDNNFDQLGRKGAHDRFKLVTSLHNKFVVQAACGSYHTVVFTNNNEIYSFGDNRYSQCPGAKGDSARHPQKFQLDDLKVSYITASYLYTFAITTDGGIHVWGSGTLENSENSDRRHSKSHRTLESLGLSVQKISSGCEHILALSSNGNLYGLGSNKKGQLGLGSDIISVDTLKFVSHLSDYVLSDVCCGSYHSVVLSSCGRVFSFGSNGYAQLGYLNLDFASLPSQVNELRGEFIEKITCGRDHTVVYSKSSEKFYAFGKSNMGQCGNKGSSFEVSPYQIDFKLPRHENSKYQVYGMACGGDSCFVLLALECNRSLLSPHPKHNPYDLFSAIPEINSYGLGESFWLNHDSFLRYGESSYVEKQIVKDHLRDIFNSISCLNSSFVRTDKKYWLDSSHNIDLEMLRQFGNKLIEFKELSQEVFPLIDFAINNFSTIKWVHREAWRFVYLFLALPLGALTMKKDLVMEVVKNIYCWGDYYKFLQPFLVLPLSMFEVFLKAIKNSFVEIFSGSRYTHYMTYANQCGSGLLFQTKFLATLRALYYFNEKNNLTLFSSFYIENIRRVTPIENGFIANYFSPNSNLFAQAYFLFNTELKTELIRVYSNLLTLTANEVKLESNSPYEYLLQVVSHLEPNKLFQLDVTRERILEDYSECLYKNLQFPIRKIAFVVFKNEFGQDIGGVRKEFFNILLQEFLIKYPDALTLYEDTQLFWFPESTTYDINVYYILGSILGFAVYNSININLHMPLALYQKLLGYKTTFESFAELCPVVARNLEEMLSHESDDFEEIYPLNFTIDRIIDGQLTTKDLISDGGSITVTKNNRSHYVNTYCNYILNTSCRQSFSEFERGFHVVKNDLLQEMLKPVELKEIVLGSTDYDFSDLEKNTIYTNGYTREAPTIEMFWSVLHELTMDLKKKFLKFLTGTENLPIGGLASVGMTVSLMKAPTTCLPVSRTCFVTLELPRYQTRQLLKEKLLKAIEHYEGFGLV